MSPACPTTATDPSVRLGRIPTGKRLAATNIGVDPGEARSLNFRPVCAVIGAQGSFELEREFLRQQTRHIFHRTADAVAAIKRALRPAPHLDPFHIPPGLTPLEIERAALVGFLAFAREHKEIYRIIDETEFVDPAAFRLHYETTAERIQSRLRAGAEAGALRGDLGGAHAWAIMGMNLFLGLLFAVWSDSLTPDEVADAAQSILARGIAADCAGG